MANNLFCRSLLEKRRMFHYPKKVSLLTLPDQDKDCKDFGGDGMEVWKGIEFLANKVKQRTGLRPNHYWLPLREYLALQRAEVIWTLAVDVGGFNIYPVRQMIGMHAAYIRSSSGIEPQKEFIGYAHPDLKSCPEYCAWLIPKAYENLIEGHLV